MADSLEVKMEEKYAIIDVCKYLNVECGEELVKTADELISKKKYHIVLNFENTELLNSMGISCLIEIVEKLRYAKGRMYFLNLSSFIEKTLSIMGIFNFTDKLNDINEINL